MNSARYLAVAIWCAASAVALAQTNRFVHQSGRRIVDGDGQPLQLRGVNLGGWLLWEGWIFGGGFTSQSTITEKLAELVGHEEASRYRDQIYQNFIAEADLAKIAALGFNSVRAPFNWHLLEEDSGWQVLDSLMDNCEKHHLYVVLDMHAVPGGQNGLFICDPGPSRDSVWASRESQERTIALWKKIADRFRNRSVVAGYDLINEPVAPSGDTLVELYRRIIAAIRTVDAQHLIILEGNKLATDFTMFSGPLTDNQMYSFHIYNWFGDDREKRFAQYRDLSIRQNVPVWCGEFGENQYEMIRTTVQMFESPDNGFSGWAFWTWKKAPTLFPGLVMVKLPSSWRPVIDGTGSWFGRKPDRRQAVNGLDDFLKAARLENCQLDQEMLAALKATADR